MTLYFEAPNATRALIANDAAFSAGLLELDLETLTPLSGDLYHYPEPWDLNDGLPEGLGDGLRSVYVKLENALGIQGKAESHAVVLDTTTPSLSVALAPEQSAYAPGTTVQSSSSRPTRPSLALPASAWQGRSHPRSQPERRLPHHAADERGRHGVEPQRRGERSGTERGELVP